MDKTIRRNETCCIGLPKCDYVFSSTRSCFIAYGFEESTLEMTILRNLLEQQSIQPEEAGGNLTPAQNAFCAKICSKIITSQFCMVLLNNDEKDGSEIPNANVNMEYGLMLGFNKYIIPFQRESQELPFNVSGLDTIKYTDRDLEQKAKDSIEQAIKETDQDEVPKTTPDQIYQIFYLQRNVLMAAVETEGERNLYRLGDTLGFNLLHDFAGDIYIYFGRLTSLRPEIALWRVRKLNEVLNSRKASMPNRVKQGIIPAEQLPFVEKMFNDIKIWISVTADEHKAKIIDELAKAPIDYDIEVLSINDINSEIQRIGS